MWRRRRFRQGEAHGETDEESDTQRGTNERESEGKDMKRRRERISPRHLPKQGRVEVGVNQAVVTGSVQLDRGKQGEGRSQGATINGDCGGTLFASQVLGEQGGGKRGKRQRTSEK
jgi:hypothetical protein